MEHYDGRYYQLENGTSKIGVCLLSNNGTVLSRGVSIEKNKAPYNELKANIHAERALKGRKNFGLIMNDEELIVLMEVLDDRTNFIKQDGMYLGMFHPTLTRHEEELLDKADG